MLVLRKRQAAAPSLLEIIQRQGGAKMIEVHDAGGATELTVNIIPHTGQQTTLGNLAPNRQLNVEVDVLARYLQRMIAARSQ